ncbi:MAG: alpha-2-macroglobulin family protein [Deltaproteobacteria bacterium]
MRNPVNIFILFLFVFISCAAPKTNIMNSAPKKPDMKKDWQKIDSLEQQGLIKSALEIVDSIYNYAKINKITDQKIKALFYKAKYANTLEENSVIKFEKTLNDEISTADQPEKSILQSILAEFYDNYLSANFYKISKITDFDDSLNTDIQTWSAGRLIRQSNELFDASISYPHLKSISFSSIPDIFTDVEKTSGLRESLFEILAQRALDHYKNDRNYLPSSKEKFIINNRDFYNTPDLFVNLNIYSSIPEDPKFKTILLFRELEKNSLEKKDYPELIDICLKRLEFVKSQYLLQDGTDLYISTLKKLIDQYKEVNEISEAYFLLAQVFLAISNENPGENKWKIKEALELCNTAESKYANSPGAEQCKALKFNILEKNLSCSTEYVNLPGEDILTEIRYKNLKRIYQKLIIISESTLEELNKMYKDQDIYLNSLPVFNSWIIDLPDDGDLREHSIEYGIEALKTGSYILISSDNESFLRNSGLFIYQVFNVSNLAYWQKNDKSGNFIFVLNRKSGAPVENARVAFYEYKWNDRIRQNEKVLFSQGITNKDGFVKVPGENDYKSYEIVISKDLDILSLSDNVYIGRSRENFTNTNVIFFTDRSIYRPGQTLYYKGLMINYDQDGIPSAVKNKTDVKIRFLDTNHQPVAEITTKTNEFGSFNGSFAIPGAGLTGTMFINELSTNSYYSVKVEEYKRPKFEVTFEEYKENYKLGDKIMLTGNAQTFAGFPLQNAKVNFTVKRKVYYPYYYWYRIPPQRGSDLEISHGTLTTDENGKFTVPVDLFASDLDINKEILNFDFDIYADVTDITGETHSNTKTLYASSASVNIAMNTPDKIREEQKMEINITATNNSGQKSNAKGKVNIYKLREPSTIFRDRYWAKPDTFIFSRDEFYRRFPFYAYKNEDEKKSWNIDFKFMDFEFNTEKNEKYSYQLKDGEYKIVLDYKDPEGKNIKIENFVSVYSDKKMPPDQLLLIFSDKNEYDVPSSAKIQWQSSTENLKVFSTLWKRNFEVVENKWITINRSLSNKITVTEDMRGGLMVSNTFIFNNRYYEITNSLNIPWSNKQLSFEYINFRSKLYPGQNEEWKIKVSGNKAENFITEILAGMYDASLDKIFQSDWVKTINYPSVSYRPVFAYGFNQTNSIILYPDNYFSRYYPDSYKSYRNINWFGFNLYEFQYYDNVVLRSDGMQYKKSLDTGAVPPDSMQPEAEASMPPPPRNGGGTEIVRPENIAAPKQDKKTEESGKTRIQLRSNLKETVFFFPEIKTDEKGNFTLSFKMNEALTKWKLRLFANTKDLKYAYDEKEIFTQKDIMITPNNPRFVRRGDNLKFSLKIENLTERTLTGNAWVELLDAATMQPVEKMILSESHLKDFSVNSKNSTSVQWEMNFNKEVPDLIIYRFYARSGDFSDAEEGFLPVLTNQKLVTESLPLWARANETRSFTLQSLKNSNKKDLQNISYTIEATSNPVWICIQSLPYIKNIKYENTVSLTDALFANMLASKIVEENPQIRRVYEKWQLSSSNVNREALLSSLSKNQELKNIVLEETPWVLESIDEEEQKKNIALLFDLNQVSNDTRNLISKLSSHQNPDGGFPWFTGGKSSRYISQYVLEAFGKLRKIKALDKNNEIDNILDKLLIFVNEEVVRDYKHLLDLAAKKQIDLQKNNLSSLDIHYLYTIQLYPETNKNDLLNDAVNYYTDQLKKYWNEQALYLKAMIAVILHRSNDDKTPVNILRALEEQSVYSEELGRYWKAYHGYNWWQLPIETQAMIIEAFSEISKKNTITDELRIWLIKNKQTNSWKTAKAGVSAIYSLLLDNGASLKEVKPLSIFIENRNITISKDEIQAGTGYYKIRYRGNKVKSEMADIKIQNSNQNIAFGAVYWQYLQDLDKIQSFGETPLKIVKELFKVKNTDTGEKLELLQQAQNLEKGDLIRVKIRLEVDRPMEFVHLSDQRAAALEPLDQLSRHLWQGGLGFYQNPRDTKMNFFIDYLPKGVFVLEYSLRVTQSGSFSNGIAELQSYYAPEFSSHSGGMSIIVK